MALSALQVAPSDRQPAAPLGPIASLLSDPSITEVMINGPGTVYVERAGQILLTDRSFEDENHLLRAIVALASSLGRTIDPTEPVMEGRLPDGSRLTVALPPVAVDGPLVAIRKFSPTGYTLEHLIRLGSLSVEAAAFLRACVRARANILVSGGSSSGKTTVLNVLSSFIDDRERIVTVEDAAELRLQQEHVCRLEAPVGGDRMHALRRLVSLAVRMRPDRVLVGEVRGPEALDVLQALNTGHDGAMSTIHANSPRDALLRLETLVLMAGLELPVSAVRRQIASVLDVVVHVGRLSNGSRRVMSIAEVAGVEDRGVTMQEIFLSEMAEAGGAGHGTRLAPTGVRPRIIDRAYRLGVAGAEVQRLFPPNRATAPLEMRRSPSGAPPEVGGPTGQERRLG
jgi:pilus assembly protein CpaF